jgi:hypothetical protein
VRADTPDQAADRCPCRLRSSGTLFSSPSASIEFRVLLLLFIDHTQNLSYEMNARPQSRVEEEETPMLSLTMRTKPEARLLQAGWSTCAPSLPCPVQGSYLRPLHIKSVDSRFENAEGLS